MSHRVTSLARSTAAGPLLAVIALSLCANAFGAGLSSTRPDKNVGLAADEPPLQPSEAGDRATLHASSRMSVDNNYRLSAGDVVQITVFAEPTLSGSFRIGPGGSIGMPLLGQTGLRGMTLTEAKAFLSTKIGTLVRRPNVTVTVDEISSVRKVYVSGELGRNGALTLPFGSTLTDAVSAAGPGPFADLRRVRLTHPGAKPIEVDCSGLRGEGALGTEHRLEYGDTVFVPRVREEIMILGEVRVPGTMLLPVEREITVLDALRTSQGFTPTADRSNAVLLRSGSDPITIDLDALLKKGDISQNRQLQGGDVLVVHQVGSISVVGQVQAPRVFQSPVPIPILQGLASAGGPSPTGDLTRAEIIREGETITVDLQKFLEEGQAPAEFALQPGDVLVIPKGEGQNVLVMGALGRTGIVNLRGIEQRDLLRVVTMSGPGAGSDLTRVTVYRGNETIVRDLKTMMEDGDVSQNLDLEPGDLVMVPLVAVDSVLVTGAVSRRGVMRVAEEEDHDLLRIVTLAGPGAISNLSRVQIHRKGETIVRDLQAAIDEGKLEESLAVEDGDVIVVPQLDETVVVTGAMQRTGLISLVNDEWRDLGRLIIMSGPLAIADLTHVTVSRGDEKIVVNVQDYIEKGDRSKTLELMDGDMVRVPRIEDSIMLTGALSRGGVLRLYPGVDRDLAGLVLSAGPVQMADLENVTIHRQDADGKDVTIVKNLRAMIDSGDRRQTVEVLPGDIITVPVREVHNILITGAVGRSGLISLMDEERRDLARLVTMSGPLVNADLTKVQIHRGGSTTIRDIQAYIDTGLEAHTLLLEDGDVVVVPRGEHTILVMGAVARAGTLQLIDEKQRDLMRLVTMAGALPNADLTRVTVFRGDQQIERDLKKLMRDGDLSQTLTLQDGDIVRVPAYEESILMAGASSRVGVVGLGPDDQRDLARMIVASSPSPYADLRNVKVHRGGETITRDVYAYIHEGDREQTLQLEDGDVVLIPLDRETALITGAVQRAGSIRASDPEQRDLVEIVLTVGPLPTADLSRVTVYRGDAEQKYDLTGLREEGFKLPQDVEVLPGDRVFVPGLDATTVLITGAVARPGTMELATREQRDLAKVVTSAQWSSNADLSQVTVYRDDEAITRDLRAYFEGGDASQTLALEDGDRILVPELGAKSITITGQVSRSGPLPQAVGRTPDLFGVVTLAGPIRQTADLTQVAVYRNGEKLVRDLKKLEEEGDLSQNLILQPGDMVHVPEASESVVFTGEVSRPGPINVHAYRQRDLGRLLPLVGPDPKASLEAVTIYRDGEAIVKDYRALIEKGDMSQNIELEPGDFIYVPRDLANDVMVLGAVQRNGIVNVREKPNRDLLRIVTIMQPLATADLTRVTVFRKDAEPEYRNLRRLQDEGDLSQTMNVQGGDVIMVPRMDDIYVLGAVNRPGAYPLDPDWGLLDVIARAGLGQGSQQRVIVIRKRPDGTTEHVEASLQGLGRGKVPEPVKIKAGDIIFAPPRKAPGRSLWQMIRDAIWTVGAITNIFD